MDHLTYADYLTLGGTVSEAEFPMLEARAHRIVDTLTHGRLADESPLRDTVRYCLVQLIRAIAADDALTGGSGREIKAMSNDGVSVTYGSASSVSGADDARARYSGIVREWLAGEADARGTLLLYAGVDA